MKTITIKNYNEKKHTYMYFIKKGDLNGVKWLVYNKRDIPVHPRMFDTAAAQGHLHIVKFLHFNTKVKGSKTAMNFASRNGFLDVVQFLHFNRDEGCSQLALEMAAINGHLEVVKFLFWHRHIDCDQQFVNMTIENGHLEVVKFLFDIMGKTCGYNTIRNCYNNNKLTMFKYLVDNTDEQNLDYLTEEEFNIYYLLGQKGRIEKTLLVKSFIKNLIRT